MNSNNFVIDKDGDKYYYKENVEGDYCHNNNDGTIIILLPHKILQFILKIEKV